jgi:hypothetical protein
MKLKIAVLQTRWKWSVKECLPSVIWPFRWDCSMDSSVHWNLKCCTTQDDWAEYCNIHSRCSDHHVAYPVRYLGDEVCITFLFIIVQNLCTERGDPSPSSVCSLQTTGHMRGKLDWSRAMSLWPSPSWWNSRMTAMAAQMVAQLVASFSEYESNGADRTVWNGAARLLLPSHCAGVTFTCDPGFSAAVPAITWPGRLINPGIQEDLARCSALVAHLCTIVVLLDLSNAVRARTGWRGTLMVDIR